MAVTLSSLLPDVLGRIEDQSPPGPIFWNLIGEVYPQMVDGLYEAALISGLVQANDVLVTLSANQTYFSLQNNTSIGIPKGVIAALRMRAPYSIRKTSLKALDDMTPNWQNATPSDTTIAWFPLGVSSFGIYPALSDESQVVMDFLVSPINEYRPYSGSETIPLQVEFTDLVSQYAAANLRSKEAGLEAEESAVVYQEYLSKIKQLSAFSGRLDSVVFSAAYGAQAGVNPRTVV